MAITSTTTNYTGRVRDISIFQNPNAEVLGAQEITPTFGKNTRFCSGVQKLVQRYAIILLTDLTSQPNYPTFGTSFMSSLKAGISPTDRLAATQIFALASYSTVLTLRSYQATHPELPPDEKISRALLTGISLYGSAVSFNVSIYTEAGSSVSFLVPLPL